MPAQQQRWLSSRSGAQAAADWQKLVHLPYAANLMATEQGQGILQKAVGLSPDAMRQLLAWRVRGTAPAP